MPSKPRPKVCFEFTDLVNEAARDLVEKHPGLSFHDAYIRLEETCCNLEADLDLCEAFQEWLEDVAKPEVETDHLHEVTGIERYPAEG